MLFSFHLRFSWSTFGCLDSCTVRHSGQRPLCLKIPVVQESRIHLRSSLALPQVLSLPILGWTVSSSKHHRFFSGVTTHIFHQLPRYVSHLIMTQGYKAILLTRECMNEVKLCPTRTFWRSSWNHRVVAYPQRIPELLFVQIVPLIFQRETRQPIRNIRFHIGFVGALVCIWWHRSSKNLQFRFVFLTSLALDLLTGCLIIYFGVPFGDVVL